jgi:hypothetical protein
MANKNAYINIIGVSDGRPEDDYYPTPVPTTMSLLENVDFEGTIYEPACGDGMMARVLVSKYGEDMVTSSDLHDRKYGIPNIDFLTVDESVKYDNVITNPPYKLALEFLLKAKKIANKKIALLMKIQFLEGVSRYLHHIDKDFPLSQVFVFTKRQTFIRNGEDPQKYKGGSMMTFIWAIWDKDYKGEHPELHFFNPNAGQKI